MEITFKYTKHQVPRRTIPDDEDATKYYLLKNVSILHATYQIRLLTYYAIQNNKKLIIRVPKHCKKGDSLKEFMKEYSKSIKIERV